jgi:hypothetical protein
LHISIGEKYNRLTVVAEAENKHSNRYIFCKCDCGRYKTIALSQLLNGNTKSCGCLKKELRIKQNIIHGLAKHPLYRVWSSMKRRCFNSNDESYKNYGARGIVVCSKWMVFKEFYIWAINNGYARGLTIERVDNDGNYDPSNCKLVPLKEQSKNRRSNHWIKHNGETKIMSQWAIDLNINYGTLKDRLHRGWTIKKALETPIKKSS